MSDKDEGSLETQEVVSQRQFVPLSRLHSAEVALAAAQIREAQRALQDAQMNASRVAKTVLTEMGLSLKNLVNLDTLVVLPPQGEAFVVEKDE